MNEAERLTAIETAIKFFADKLENIEIKLDNIDNRLINYEARIIQREQANGFQQKLIDELYQQIKTTEEEVNLLKRFAWIGMGILITLQFAIPLLLQHWR